LFANILGANSNTRTGTELFAERPSEVHAWLSLVKSTDYAKSLSSIVARYTDSKEQAAKLENTDNKKRKTTENEQPNKKRKSDTTNDVHVAESSLSPLVTCALEFVLARMKAKSQSYQVVLTQVTYVLQMLWQFTRQPSQQLSFSLAQFLKSCDDNEFIQSSEALQKLVRPFRGLLDYCRDKDHEVRIEVLNILLCSFEKLTFLTAYEYQRSSERW
jgi:hypothetical protein